jgi:hypothetical protein
MTTTATEPTRALDFIREIIEADLRSGRHPSVITRSRPSPTATSTSVTPNRSALTSAWRPITAAVATSRARPDPAPGTARLVGAKGRVGRAIAR